MNSRRDNPKLHFIYFVVLILINLLIELVWADKNRTYNIKMDSIMRESPITCFKWKSLRFQFFQLSGDACKGCSLDQSVDT